MFNGKFRFQSTPTINGYRCRLPDSGMLFRSLVLAAVVVGSFAGCQSEPARFRQNMAYKRKQELQVLSGEGGAASTLSRAVTQDVADILSAMFGTPDAPALPAVEGVELPKIASMRRLQMAAGPVNSDEQGVAHGLFREHCVHCHGVSGDGAGPTAAFLNPYPRDYRLGLYKFKSTRKGEKPTHEDLKRIVNQGIPGTAMPSFALLPEQEVEALVEYVKYLSIRGEVERRLFVEAVNLENAFDTLHGSFTSLSGEVDTLELSRVKDPALAEAKNRLRQAYYKLQEISPTAEDYKRPEDADAEEISTEDAQTRIAELKTGLEELEQGLANYKPPRMIEIDPTKSEEENATALKEQLAPYLEIAKEIMEKWVAPQSVAVKEPEQPIDPSDRASIARGKAIFYGTTANCFSCHGESGLGDGQRDFYDDWSGEWVEKGKPPELTDEYVSLGALPPRNLMPRNLRTGVYRGGRRPVDLYWRITNGIDGAQMPAVPMRTESDPPEAKKLSEQDVWDLINYVKSMPYESISQPPQNIPQMVKEVH